MTFTTKNKYTTIYDHAQPKKRIFINGWELPYGEILAPMAGISDSPYRRIVKRFGAGLLVTECISAEGVKREGRVSLQMTQFHLEERPISVQLFGSRPEQFEAAGAIVAEQSKPDMIDINCGCPVKKFVTRFCGGWLMQDPDLIGKIVEATKRGSGLPVSVKLRIGYARPDITVIRAAQAAEAAGAELIAVHGRWVRGSKGTNAEWDYIAQVKQAVSVPVIGNGDLRSYEDVSRMVNATGCDRVMIGRWAAGRPWLFSGLAGENYPVSELKPPPMKERITILLDHYLMMVEQFGEYGATLRMRKHLGWYTRGMPGGASVRDTANKLRDYRQVLDLLYGFRDSLPENHENPPEEVDDVPDPD